LQIYFMDESSINEMKSISEDIWHSTFRE